MKIQITSVYWHVLVAAENKTREIQKSTKQATCVSYERASELSVNIANSNKFDTKVANNFLFYFIFVYMIMNIFYVFFQK